ncbi:hypothetical protein [Lentilactobacillus laojiaonis]|uniref:hypothetical protein n=1 Tax=Lentilactobacillus laojiaonis TaxID=2883998 RepID=UPI001D0ABD9D|nr:hypothetical protein [Lentilactobacillus laojiaonis]UDM32429.1 hypothetical protein LHL71_01465 [Lentilactobacillus laojiaonis]
MSAFYIVTIIMLAVGGLCLLNKLLNMPRDEFVYDKSYDRDIFISEFKESHVEIIDDMINNIISQKRNFTDFEIKELEFILKKVFNNKISFEPQMNNLCVRANNKALLLTIESDNTGYYLALNNVCVDEAENLIKIINMELFDQRFKFTVTE